MLVIRFTENRCSLLESAAKRIYLGAASTVGTTRTIPLTSVRGISSEIDERLQEEGIIDAHTLASADPIRLLRNTPFDKRMIACWIDNAILVSRLPEYRDQLEKLGIRGASELARYGAEMRLTKSATPSASLLKLAAEIHLDAVLLADACLRFWEDSQVRLVWLLYKVEGDGTQPASKIQDEDLIQAIATLEDMAADPQRRLQQQAVISQAAREMGPADPDGLAHELSEIATAYQGLRAGMPPGVKRTQEMSRLMARARIVGRALSVKTNDIISRFETKTDGNRIVALVLSRDKPSDDLLPIVIDAIANSRSAFEQYNALLVASELKNIASPATIAALGKAIRGQIGDGNHIELHSDRNAVAARFLEEAPVSVADPIKAPSTEIDRQVS